MITTRTSTTTTKLQYQFLPLREFGDKIESSVLAGLLATANGLREFQIRNQYCTYCGSKTYVANVGGNRKCSTCSKSVYPRIDVASIMLITDSTNQYALLGRKQSWPIGRYSTLAGFMEVGETIEQCCIRETYEESGVQVDPTTIQYVTSQPWPFPQSIMVGFYGRAYPVSINATSSSSSSSNDNSIVVLPEIIIDTKEMEDIRWFSKEYVKQHVIHNPHNIGSTALKTYTPNQYEKEFHIPGKSSLGRLLITQWCTSSD